MNPLFLGTAERRIFGIHDPAAAHEGRARAVLLCHPLGSEYTYAHRSMRQLAAKLASSGFHTLRFDYFGTGDSGGDEIDTNPAGRQADIETALETLKDISQAPKVTLIGLRAGANVAARAAISVPSEVDSLVLWDPILPDDELGSSLGSLPPRSLILATDPGTYEQLSQVRATHGEKQPIPVELVPAPCPWIESATTTGALPVPVIQRIQQWLR
jgi:uncharacterized protein